jgi:hypothetical protein
MFTGESLYSEYKEQLKANGVSVAPWHEIQRQVQESFENWSIAFNKKIREAKESSPY